MDTGNASLRLKSLHVTIGQMFVYDDTTQTPQLSTVLSRAMHRLPESWRDCCVLEFLVANYSRHIYVNHILGASAHQDDLEWWTRPCDSSAASGAQTAFLHVPVENSSICRPSLWKLTAGAGDSASQGLARAPGSIRVIRGEKGFPSVPWWESQLPVLRKELTSNVRRRLPTRQADQEDLVSATLLSFCEQIRRRPRAFPESWFSPLEPDSDEDRSYLRQLLNIILRRRIADLFRAETREWSTGWVDSLHAVPSGPGSNLEKQALLAAILAVIIKQLTSLNQHERDLLALVSGTDGEFEKALEARDRQRLKRLRMKLAAEIRMRFGAKVSDLIADDI